MTDESYIKRGFIIYSSADDMTVVVTRQAEWGRLGT